jgi:hypothetical protein
MARAKPAIALPAEDCDLRSGRAQIAEWFGLTCGQASAASMTAASARLSRPGGQPSTP